MLRTATILPVLTLCAALALLSAGAADAGTRTSPGIAASAPAIAPSTGIPVRPLG